jgi:hypothetical protein
VSGPSHRLVLYDTPEHGVEFIERLCRDALALPQEAAEEIAGRLRFDFHRRVPMPDRATAECAMEKVLLWGRDPANAASRGSLAVALEEVGNDGTVAVLRCGRAIDGAFVAMDRAAIEEFIGGLLDESRPYGDVLLVVEGRATGARMALLCLTVLPLLALASIISLSSGLFPLLYRGAGAPSPLAVLLVLAVPFGAFFLWAIHRSRSTGRVAFFEKAIVIDKRETPATLATPLNVVHVPWGDLRAFRDGDGDYIQLVRKADRRSPLALTVPTLVETDRTAVLALLLERGIPREEERDTRA